MAKTLELANGHGTARVYYVEARTTLKALNADYQTVGDTTYGPNWKRVEFTGGAVGVPVGYLPPGAREHGYVTLEAAIALAAWFRASLELKTRWPVFGLETRLVEVQWEYSFAGTLHAYGPSEVARPNTNEWTVAASAGGGEQP
jgi:hypothetical protein